MSSYVSRMNIARNKNAARNASALNRLSCCKCMKNVATSPAFTVAISIATMIFSDPKS